MNQIQILSQKHSLLSAVQPAFLILAKKEIEYKGEPLFKILRLPCLHGAQQYKAENRHGGLRFVHCQ